jgi:membrane-bound lytic murein transglycosylase B
VVAAFWALETDFGAVQGDFGRSMRWPRFRMIAGGRSCFGRS